MKKEKNEWTEVIDDTIEFIDELIRYKNGSICGWKLQVVMNYMNAASAEIHEMEKPLKLKEVDFLPKFSHSKSRNIKHKEEEEDEE